MDAELMIRFRDVTPEGGLIELVVWKVPASVDPSRHGYKYRLVYVVEGRRVVGFDNERGKGDHMHVGEEEFPYDFVDVDRLLADFRQEVEKWNAR